MINMWSWLLLWYVFYCGNDYCKMDLMCWFKGFVFMVESELDDEINVMV